MPAQASHESIAASAHSSTERCSDVPALAHQLDNDVEETLQNAMNCDGSAGTKVYQTISISHDHLATGSRRLIPRATHQQAHTIYLFRDEYIFGSRKG
jgi:hypothetical protein